MSDSNLNVDEPVRETVRDETRKVTAVSWLTLIGGLLWIAYGMFVLSYRSGSLISVAALIGCAFIAGGISMLVVATRVSDYKWLYIIGGIMGIITGIVALAWPSATLYVTAIMVACFLVVFGVMHIIGSLAGSKPSWWWTELLLGIAELVLGVWALRSWQNSIVTLLALVGTWAIFFGTAHIFAAFGGMSASSRVKGALKRF